MDNLNNVVDESYISHTISGSSHSLNPLMLLFSLSLQLLARLTFFFGVCSLFAAPFLSFSSYKLIVSFWVLAEVDGVTWISAKESCEPAEADLEGVS